MTPTQLKEAAHVMLAAAEGKRVQFRYGDKYQWEDVNGDPGWNWHIRTYRIKPEPREFYICTLDGRPYYVYAEKPMGVGLPIVKVREVIE